MIKTKNLQPEQEQIFRNWLKQIYASDLDGLIITDLRNDFAYTKDWINHEEFRKNNPLNLERWIEASILLRDINLTEILLYKLDKIERRNALAALYGYRTRNEIAVETKMTETHIGKLLKIGEDSKQYPETLKKLSLGLDVTEDHIG